MSSLLLFERERFGVLHVEKAAARKEVPTSPLEEAWESLEMTKTVPQESLVEKELLLREIESMCGIHELVSVRNIPDINQILTEEKCWKQVKECPRGGAKFDREFPPLSGEKKNQNLGKTDFYENQNNLTSGQAPAPSASLPAPSPPPATRLPTPPPADLPAPGAPADCQLPTRVPGPTPQPTKTHHDTQPIRKVP
ncbi:hypothetical protein DSO57_1000881 [Entomophthora muscae]|uniref:Uncharacterized protein n=1 Tax=Entomophthora muscae TaxID=34485 RepID=A0ACC2SY27_9FUNG|nr:hypothetical protein DSO57_1000881 [Entomophthora muscae]